MGQGDDTILCESDCIVYGEAGSDTFSVTSGILDIRDFNPAEDVINLKPYQSNIKIPEQITYTTEDNGMTFVLAISDQATIRVHTTTKVAGVANLNIIYDAPSCYRKCNLCVNEIQCELCSGCEECDGASCTACSSSTFLQEGKCITDCTTNYLRHPDTSINHCILCTQANCLGCTTANYCSQCSSNFIPQFGVCNTCLNAKGYYSNDRDQTCSKCGTGCDSCTETNCINCAAEYLYAPKLSTQFCFLKLSVSSLNINPIKQVASTKSQQKVLSGCIFNSDGTVSQMNPSVKMSSGNFFVSPLQLQTRFIDENANQVPFDSTVASRRVLGGEDFSLDWVNNHRVLASKIATYVSYKQIDDKWSAQVIMKSNMPLSTRGSVVTCVAMILAGMGKQINGELVNPSNLNQWLGSNRGYGDVDFVWESVKSNFGLTYVGKFTNVDELIAYYKKGNAVILAVYQGIHKVLMTGLDKSGNNLYVNDPGSRTQRFYDKTEVRFGYVYKMPIQSSVPPQKTSAIYATDIQSFERFAYGFQSCYQYTQSFSNALFSKDQNELIKLPLQTPSGMERVKVFNQIVQDSFIKKPQPCLQSNLAWQIDRIGTFGITQDSTGKYDALWYYQSGSQMCSLAMVLSSLGIKDPISKLYYSPDSINLLLVKNNAFKSSEFKLTLDGSQKSFTAKNIVDWAKVMQLQLFGFGLNSITQLKSSQNALSLTSDQFTTLKQLIRGQKNRVILEVKSTNAGETYYVYAANKFEGNTIQVIDPINSQTRFVQMQDIVNYVQISVKKLYQSFEINELYNLLAGNPYYHAIFRFKSADGSIDKIKSYYLMSWKRTDNTPILKETFTVLDLNSDSSTYKQQISLLALQDIDGSPFTLSQAEVFVNKQYVVDKSSYVENQACTRKEVQSYIGLNQQSYNNALNQISYCFDNQITLASDLSANCPPNSENVLTCSQFFCASQFKKRIDPIEVIINAQADIPKGDSRYCSLMKLSYQFNDFQYFSTNSKLMSSIKYKQYSSAAFALINTKYACLAQPNQLMEVFLGMQSGLSPAIAKPLTASEPQLNSLVYDGTDRKQVCANIKINAITGSSGQSAKYVRRAILLARYETESGDPNVQEMKSWITERGWRRSTIGSSQAQIGDIVIFQPYKTHSNGHIAVKCDDGWYSDWNQKSFYILNDGCKPPFVIYN